MRSLPVLLDLLQLPYGLWKRLRFSPRIGYTGLMINTDQADGFGREGKKVLIAGSGILLAAYLLHTASTLGFM